MPKKKDDDLDLRFDPREELGLDPKCTFDVHIGEDGVGPKSDDGPAPDDPDVIDLGPAAGLCVLLAGGPYCLRGETTRPQERAPEEQRRIDHAGPGPALPRRRPGLRDEGRWWSYYIKSARSSGTRQGAVRRPFMCKTTEGPTDHYDRLMCVSTPRTKSWRTLLPRRRTRPGGKNYDPLYDWSLYGREDHPRWLQFCREEKMRDEAKAKGLIPPGTTDFDGVDRYGEKTTPSSLMGTARRSTTPSTRALPVSVSEGRLDAF